MEAAEGRSRLVVNQSDNVAHVDNTAWNDEVSQIYHSARPETRVLYDLGRDLERTEGENWIIRWMLWHVFRYRDYRNNNNNNKGQRAIITTSGPSNSLYSFPADILTGPNIAASETNEQEGKSKVQVVTLNWKPVQSTLTVQEHPPSQAVHGQFWDPVRNKWQTN